jgi:hypothetical protein
MVKTTLLSMLEKNIKNRGKGRRSCVHLYKWDRKSDQGVPLKISVFEIFKIGIGPSSSHTVGPMRAAHAFASELLHAGLLSATSRIQVEFFGSLALTGKGHVSDRAIVLGLLGEFPDIRRA